MINTQPPQHPFGKFLKFLLIKSHNALCSSESIICRCVEMSRFRRCEQFDKLINSLWTIWLSLGFVLQSCRHGWGTSFERYSVCDSTRDLFESALMVVWWMLVLAIICFNTNNFRSPSSTSESLLKVSNNSAANVSTVCLLGPFLEEMSLPNRSIASSCTKGGSGIVSSSNR